MSAKFVRARDSLAAEVVVMMQLANVNFTCAACGAQGAKYIGSCDGEDTSDGAVGYAVCPECADAKGIITPAAIEKINGRIEAEHIFDRPIVDWDDERAWMDS